MVEPPAGRAQKQAAVSLRTRLGVEKSRRCSGSEAESHSRAHPTEQRQPLLLAQRPEKAGPEPLGGREQLLPVSLLDRRLGSCSVHIPLATVETGHLVATQGEPEAPVRI